MRDLCAAAVEAPPVVEVQRLPLVGSIAAGGPILAEENIEDELGVPEPLGRSVQGRAEPVPAAEWRGYTADALRRWWRNW